MNDSPPSAQSLVGTILSDRYRIVKLLGEGGMGAVYLAEHTLMRKRVAIKVLHPEMTEIDEVVARFEREARVSAGIDHPNVALATDFGRMSDGGFFLVLEFIEGKSLRDVLHEQGPMSIDRALRIVRQMADALAAAHRLGVVHRDLKPENVMLVEKPTNPDFVKILDFGIAKESGGKLGGATVAGKALTQLGVMYGTPEYMPPEQAMGQPVDARADLYTVGVMLFEMLSGVRPFEAPEVVALVMQIITSPAPPISSRVSVPPELDLLVATLMEKSPDRRLQTATDLVASIDAILARYGFAGAAVSGAYPAVSPPPSQVAASLPQPSAMYPGVAPVATNVAQVVPMSAAPAVSGYGPAPAVSGYGVPTIAPPESRVSIVNAPGTDAYMPTSMGVSPVAALAQASAASPVVTDPLEKLVADARPRLPEPLRKLPAIALLAGAAGVVVVPLLVLFVIVIAAGSSDPGPVASASASASSAPVDPPFASEREIDQARKAGPASIAALAERFPNDPAVWRAAMREYLEHKQGVAAFGALKKLVALSPKALGDDVSKETVLAAAKESDESADAVFAFLESTPAPEAVDVIYELTSFKEPKPAISARAQKSMAKSEVKDRASPALKALLNLKAAKGCDANYAVLPEVRDNADSRALAALKLLQNKTGCSSLFRTADCYPCLRKDKLLDDTIAAVEKRKLSEPSEVFFDRATTQRCAYSVALTCCSAQSQSSSGLVRPRPSWQARSNAASAIRR
ncbi:MAG: protein kinase [Polyangiaceae bacterium]